MSLWFQFHTGIGNWTWTTISHISYKFLEDHNSEFIGSGFSDGKGRDREEAFEPVAQLIIRPLTRSLGPICSYLKDNTSDKATPRL